MPQNIISYTMEEANRYGILECFWSKLMTDKMTKNKRFLLTLLSIFGLILTGELINIYFKVNFNSEFNPSFCSVSNLIDCDGVAKTHYALFLGIPLAIWGAFLYTVILFLTYIDKINEKLNIELFKVFKNPASYIATLGLVSFCCSMILAFISIFTIQKICLLCFVTYFIDLLLAIVAKSKGFFIEDIKNTAKDFFDGAKKYLALFLVACFGAIWFLGYMQTSLVLAPNLRLQKSFEEFQKMKTNIFAIKGNTLGNPDGSIVIYLYSDFLCPFCRVTNTMVHKLAKEEKNVIIYHMNFPLDAECNPALRQTIHTGACMLAKYALAAERQGAYWDMASAIYDSLPQNEDDVLTLANKIGIDKNKLYIDAHSDDVASDLQKQIQKGINFGINGTPTIVVDGIEHKSAMPYYKLKTLVKQAKNRHKHDN